MSPWILAVSTPVRVTYVAAALIAALLILVVMQVLHHSTGAGRRRVPQALMNALLLSLASSVATAAVYAMLPGLSGGRPTPTALLLIRVRDLGWGASVLCYAWGLLRLYYPGVAQREAQWVPQPSAPLPGQYQQSGGGPDYSAAPVQQPDRRQPTRPPH